MLYLIATPIGNLADFSYRAISVIQSCDYLLCEDTRRSRILLNHYALDKPLRSYHRFNEEKKKADILEDLRNGKTVGLLSDAGTPSIADPGLRLVMACREQKLPVIPIPGSCAAIVALVGSGLDTERFQFVGFLPKKRGELKKLLADALLYPGTTICYESPFRLKEALKVLEALDPERRVVIARELTKKFEEFIEGTPVFLRERWKEKPPKGEIVILISRKI